MDYSESKGTIFWDNKTYIFYNRIILKVSQGTYEFFLLQIVIIKEELGGFSTQGKKSFHLFLWTAKLVFFELRSHQGFP